MQWDEEFIYKFMSIAKEEILFKDHGEENI